MKNKTFILLLITAFAVMCFSAASAQSDHQSDSTKVCAGIKADGQICKSTWILHNGYCRVHNPDKITCSGTNNRNEPCKNVVSNAGEFCFAHRSKPRYTDNSTQASIKRD